MCPRAFMKLPPIPRDVTLSPDISRDLCENPYHVYEEIPYDALDSVIPVPCDTVRGQNVDINDLDFKHAKEFEHFLVVPRRGRNDCPPVRQNQPNKSKLTPSRSQPEVKRRSPEVASDNDSGLSFTSPPGSHKSQDSQKSQWRDPKFKWIYHDGSQAPVSSGWDQRTIPVHVCSQPHGSTHRHHQEPAQPDTGRTSGVEAMPPCPNVQTCQDEGSAPQNNRPNPTSFTNRMCLGVAALRDPIREQLLQKARVPPHSTSIPEQLTENYPEYDPQGTNSDSGINSSQTTKHSFSDSDVSGVYAMSSDDSLQSHDGSGNGTGSRVPRSDGSNDTFSEYDIKGDDDSLIQDELYDFYLSKVRDNLKLKEHVQQIIKSETDSSDYDMDSIMGGDNISLTTVTDMSESSLADEEIAKLCAEMHRLSQEIRHSSPNDECDKTKGKKDFKKCLETEFKDKCSRKRDKRPKKESKNKSKPVECYQLPDFPNQPGSAFQIYKKRSDSDSGNTSEIDMGDKLSCRATTYQHPPKGKSSKSNSRKLGHSSSGLPGSSSRVSSSNRGDRNKLLSDLMRLNHDRQIMVLL